MWMDSLIESDAKEDRWCERTARSESEADASAAEAKRKEENRALPRGASSGAGRKNGDGGYEKQIKISFRQRSHPTVTRDVTIDGVCVHAVLVVSSRGFSFSFFFSFARRRSSKYWYSCCSSGWVLGLITVVTAVDSVTVVA